LSFGFDFDVDVAGAARLALFADLGVAFFGVVFDMVLRAMEPV
jgi:hypothetical protein